MSHRQSWTIDFPSLATVLTTMGVALIAGATFGGILHATGQLESVAAVYRLDGIANDWALVFVHSLVATVVFIATSSRLSRGRYTPTPLAEVPRNVFLGACTGTAYGVVLWLGIVAYGVPLWLGFVVGLDLSLPYHHLESLPAFLCFGAVLGAWYPLLRDTFGG